MKTVLILCTGNSARSILGEVLFNILGQGRVRAFSAGSRPAGAVNPGAMRHLEREGANLSRLRSKSWSEFAGPDAPSIDIVITVCGSAAGEACPVFPGRAVRAHWGLDDPAAVAGSDAVVDAAFARAWVLLRDRVSAFMELPFETMSDADLQQALNEIGAMAGAA
jgi:arsenate reductase